MKHPSERDLVLYLTDDRAPLEGIERHLDLCSHCQTEVRELSALLLATRRLEIPEPDAGFEGRIWERQREQLHRAGVLRPSSVHARRPLEPTVVIRWPLWSPRRLLLAGSVAAMILLAFLIGLYTSPPGTEMVARGSVDAPDRERLLLLAVSDHLARTRMVLVELVNAGSEAAPGHLRDQRARAESLLGDSRLYRQTANLAGDTQMAAVLDEVERVLLELARSSEDPGSTDLQWLRDRIESRDLLFKVSVIEGRARRSETAGSGSMDAL